MIALHKPILTQQKAAPWSWLILANMMWFATMYAMFVTTVALPLTLLKFTGDARLIALVTSVGGLMGIVIGPMCNFISDRLWTHWGRRRPFLLVAMGGSLLAMVLTPYMPALVPLVLLAVVSSLLGDAGSTLEPLWLEIIPPEQRGRGVVMRVVMIQLASVYFFQVMFAQWDNRYTFDLAAAGLGAVEMSGEQITYLAGAVLIFFVIVLLLFLVREVRPEGVDLRPWRELDLNPVAFAKEFFTNVFGDRRWWPVYLFYVSPGIMVAGIGTFSNLMQVEQWKYDKGSMALMGLPPMVVSILIAAPLLGRQADAFKVYPRRLLAGIVAAAAAATWWLVRWSFPGLSATELPPFWVLMALSLTVSGAGIALVFLLTQELNRLQPSQNHRLWPWFLGPCSTLLATLGLLYYLRIHLACEAPPISHWYLATLLAGALAGFTSLAGPLLYDFMPGDKIGTLSSGFGLIGTAIGSIMSVVMGFWIHYFSKIFGGPEGTTDYSSYLLAILVTGPVSLGLMIYFFRLARKGRLVEYGRLKLNSDGHPIVAGEVAEH